MRLTRVYFFRSSLFWRLPGDESRGAELSAAMECDSESLVTTLAGFKQLQHKHGWLSSMRSRMGLL